MIKEATAGAAIAALILYMVVCGMRAIAGLPL